ncbi:MAG TPA: helix-turn-helix domain-containing protein [Streptosporangiaceae bacterium]|jgi:DNA-binding CsgD family transcriptional regulator
MSVATSCGIPDAGHALDEREVARLYLLGLTMAEIAVIFRMSAWAVAARLDRAGVVRRARSQKTELPLDRAARRYCGQPHLLGELAAQLGISAEIITVRAGKPPPRSRGVYRADVTADEVARLYRAGQTVTQIAGRYRVAPATILRRLDAAGVTRRPRSLPTPFPADEAARRVRQEGVSCAELARVYGVGADVVRRRLAAQGVRRSPGAPRQWRVTAAEVADLYAREGLTMAQIAARHGVSRWLVAARLDQAAVTPRPRGKPIPLPEATARYRDGVSLAALAARYCVSTKTMSRKLTAAGVTLRPSGRQRKDIPVDQAAALYAAGQTMSQIAQVYGTCETLIYKRFTEAGVRIRRKTDVKQVDPELMASLARQAGLDGIR